LHIKPEDRFWIGIYGFAAFVLLIAVAVFGWLAWTSKSEPGVGHVAGAIPANPAASSLPEEEYEQLAAFQAPQYVREPGAPKAFQAAMAQYQQKDYAGAASALRAVTDAKPDFVAAKFYLGVSLLLAGDRIAGIQELRALTDAGDNPYLERARFYLAKGLIAEHDIHRAQDQLEQLIAQHGDLEKQAAALLSQIRPS
jgi:predicted negative regulator of RcsB-dependent stress response